MATANVRLVRPDDLHRCVTELLQSAGLPEKDAALVAQTLVEADLRGVHSHGVMRVPTYLARIQAGEVNPRPNMRLSYDDRSRAALEADGAMGQVAADAAMRTAIERAVEYGIGAVTVRNSRHCGAMAYWAMMALDADCIGFATTNAGMNMAPTGGRQKIVGNNPFAVAVPTSRPWPMVLDMATSVVAGGKLDVAALRGQEIPLGWALDPDGQPTKDPVVARKGSLLPVGGPKGYGMAVMLDVLCGVLSGGRFGGNLGAPGSGHFFLALKVEGYIPIDEFRQRMDALIDQIHASPLAPGSERIYLPGEIEFNLEQERQRSGIPLEQRLLDRLDQLGVERGIDHRPSTWR